MSSTNTILSKFSTKRFFYLRLIETFGTRWPLIKSNSDVNGFSVSVFFSFSEATLYGRLETSQTSNLQDAAV